MLMSISEELVAAPTVPVCSNSLPHEIALPSSTPAIAEPTSGRVILPVVASTSAVRFVPLDKTVADKLGEKDVGYSVLQVEGEPVVIARHRSGHRGLIIRELS